MFIIRVSSKSVTLDVEFFLIVKVLCVPALLLTLSVETFLKSVTCLPLCESMLCSSLHSGNRTQVSPSGGVSLRTKDAILDFCPLCCPTMQLLMVEWCVCPMRYVQLCFEFFCFPFIIFVSSFPLDRLQLCLFCRLYFSMLLVASLPQLSS